MNKSSLDTLPLNRNGIIVNLNSKGSLRRRMLDLGIVKDSKIKPIFVGPFGDPRAYEIRRFYYCNKKK